MIRTSIIAATTIALLAGGARGQNLFVLPPMCQMGDITFPCPADLTATAVPTDLDKAMAICRKHGSNATATYPRNTVFENGWEACYAVKAKWYESTAAKGCGAGVLDPCPSRVLYENDDLDRAMLICQKHELPMTPTPQASAFEEK